MKKIFIILPVLFALAISTYIGIFYYKHLRGAKTAIFDPPYSIGDVITNPTESPLVLPPGFKIEVFAKDLSGARVIAFDRYGNIWVSRTKEGIVSFLAIQDGKMVKKIDVLTGLNKPHGLLFDNSLPDTLYIAEADKISSVQVPYTPGSTDPVVPSNDSMNTLVDLTGDTGIHFTRSLAYSPQGEILVSIGSSCNVCEEESSLRASIQKLEKNVDTWQLIPYATGLRNSVFLATNPVDGKIWATEMGRDLLGDTIPPDELNVIEKGNNYGWPVCYGNRIHDVQFDTKTYIMDPCALTTPSTYDLPAHVAPLGLAFIPEESFWPDEYWLDLLVAYHGSWNRSSPIGYSIVRIFLNEQGHIVGEEPFIEGWLTKNNEALGRPVDVKFMNGSLYISDDHAGVIYRVFRTDVPSPQDSELIVVDDFENYFETGETYIYNATLSSIVFTGRARGTMFFEASFPVVVTDDIGTIVAQGIAEAQADWMTENFVPFSVTLSKIDDPTTPMGKISFKKDNPSGLPEHDYTYTVPVTFSTP